MTRRGTGGAEAQRRREGALGHWGTFPRYSPHNLPGALCIAVVA